MDIQIDPLLPRPRALLDAARIEPLPEAALLQRAGLSSRQGTRDYQRSYQALRQLIDGGLLSKTGPRPHRRYALTPAGVRFGQAHPPEARPARPVCRLCGRAGGHWGGCPIWRARS